MFRAARRVAPRLALAGRAPKRNWHMCRALRSLCGQYSARGIVGVRCLWLRPCVKQDWRPGQACQQTHQSLVSLCLQPSCSAQHTSRVLWMAGVSLVCGASRCIGARPGRCDCSAGNLVDRSSLISVVDLIVVSSVNGYSTRCGQKRAGRLAYPRVRALSEECIHWTGCVATGIGVLPGDAISSPQMRATEVCPPLDLASERAPSF